jgi:hypothetical protein
MLMGGIVPLGADTTPEDFATAAGRAFAFAYV